MQPWGMTAYRLAKGLGMQQIAVSQILKGRRRVTAETAIRLSRFLGLEPGTWLRLQAAYDLEEAQRAMGDKLDFIQRYRHEGPLRDNEGRPLTEEQRKE